MNKRDKLPRDLAPSVLKQLEAHFRDAAPFRRVFSISALEGQGIGTLRQYLLHLVRGMGLERATAKGRNMQQRMQSCEGLLYPGVGSQLPDPRPGGCCFIVSIPSSC